jgi:pimeloyl-[acyl-carrier protein] methyl ester esterase
MSFRLHVERRPGVTMDAALPLVFLHGWGMNLRAFDPLRDALADEHESWAVDLAGHGASPWAEGHADFENQVQDVLAVLPPRSVLAGWSFGGKIALEIAARAPQRVEALVLLSVSPKFAQTPDWPHGMDEPSMEAFRHVLGQDWQQTLSDFVWLQLRGSRNAERARSILEAALAAQGAPHPEALVNGLDLLSTLDLRPRITAITAPTLIVSGQNDRVTSPAAARWLATAMPQARLVEIPRAGHAPFVSHHEEVATAVRGFLADIARVTAGAQA